MDHATRFASLGGIEEAVHSLKEDLANEQIHFFRIRRPHAHPEDYNVASFETNSLPSDCSGHAPVQNWLQIAVNCLDGNLVVIGFRSGKRQYGEYYYKATLNQLAADIIFGLIATLVFMRFGFRDLFLFRSRIQKVGSIRGVTDGLAFSESAQIASGFSSYEKTIQSLKSEVITLQAQILPSIRSLLVSGKKLPYTFDATMVRTDVNDYTTYFESEKQSELLCYIDEFFKRSAEIISRYKGYPHQLIGDEILFYFKSDDSDNSARMAIAALIEIGAIADEIHAESMKAHGLPFRVKSSLARSEQRVGPFMNLISLSGRNLIESVRILASAGEKENNPILYGESICGTLTQNVISKDLGEFQLKGMGKQHLFRFEAVPDLSAVLYSEKAPSRKDLQFYRSDRHTELMLDFLTNSNQERADKTDVEVLRHLSSIFISRRSSGIRQGYLRLLRAQKNRVNDERQAVSPTTIALTVGLALRFLSKEDFQGEIELEFDDEFFLQDPRVASTLLIVLAELAPASESCVTRWAESSGHARSLANDLIRLSKTVSDVPVWKKRVGSRLRKMLMSSDHGPRASGLYALGEIALDARVKDQLWFSANESIAKLLDLATEMLGSESEMVRRQALYALKKAGREHAILQIIEDAKLPSSLLIEVKQFIEDNIELDYIRLRAEGLLRSL